MVPAHFRADTASFVSVTLFALWFASPRQRNGAKPFVRRGLSAPATFRTAHRSTGFARLAARPAGFAEGASRSS
jgi:hypothetical protein